MTMQIVVNFFNGINYASNQQASLPFCFHQGSILVFESLSDQNSSTFHGKGPDFKHIQAH